MLVTESVRCQEVQQPRASATSAASGGVFLPQTENLHTRKEGIFLSIIIEYFNTTKPQSIEEFNRFLEYARKIGVIIIDFSKGSLVIYERKGKGKERLVTRKVQLTKYSPGLRKIYFN